MKLNLKLKQREPKTAVIVRWSYTVAFAKALGRNGEGRGRARRNDVKAWATAVLDEAAQQRMK